ncbi:hypothetical protein H5410_021249 [Solanum commersonii]|uniref:Uncharacterized protein n=1 Tax=Solanum commersonii TaxID=4109 RepID=A0A9J5ZDP9_SOLCO|nr:hypothetical protein H5410_021249 [Solanum commersonii]
MGENWTVLKAQGVARLNLEDGVESRHVGQFGELVWVLYLSVRNLSLPSALGDSPKVFLDRPFCAPNP